MARPFCAVSGHGTAWAADAAAEKVVFAAKCQTCHGVDGQGNPAIAKVLKAEIKPLDRSPGSGHERSGYHEIIAEGKGKMKPVAISGADVDIVVAYVKSMKK